MSSPVDLHTHTLASDGTLLASDLLEQAVALSIRHLALTDHDTTAGYEAAIVLKPRYPTLDLIPAIEINAGGELSCHILGYWIDPQNATLQTQLAVYRQARIARVRAMLEKLHALGMALEFERVWEIAHRSSVGRPHIADALIERGYVKTRQEAFDRYLKADGPAFVPADIPTAPQAIALIRQAGGIPVLAHPSYYLSDFLLQRLVQAGLLGLEVYYPDYSRSLIRRYLELAAKEHLVATGGSDFHGPRTGRDKLGCVSVPESVVEALGTLKSTLHG